jgi:hypothetical protein
MSKYIEVSSVEEVKQTKMTCFLDKQDNNTLHIHSNYTYHSLRNWPVDDEVKLERGEGNALNQLKFLEENN